MLFGNPQVKPKGLFGGFAPTGMEQTPKIDPAQLMQRNMALGNVGQAMQPKKPGINWLGVAADFLSGMAGQQGPYATSMMMQRKAQQDAEAAHQERMTGLQDWQWKKQWERDNPDPVNNDTVNDYNFILKNLGPEAASQYLGNLADPMVTVPMGNTVYSGPRSGLGKAMGGMGGSGPQPGMIEDGYQFKGGDPADANNWVKVGGGVGNGTGSFPKVTARGLDGITIQSESAGNPNAVSPKGAMGLWQVMPDTARDPGFGIRPWNGTPQDLNRVGAEYRRKMEKRYGGNLPKMWAAYNWGPGNLDKALRTYGENWLNHAPAETRAYVARNMRAVRGGK